MIDFRTALRDGILARVNEWVGPASPAHLVKYIDNYLHEVDFTTQMPYITATVRRQQKESDAEIGAPLSEQKNWTVHIYYLDMDTVFDTGDARQSTVMGLLQKRIEENRRLGNILSTDVEGDTEYVYDCEVTDVLFDSSGVDQDYSFLSELYLTVKTDRR